MQKKISGAIAFVAFVAICAAQFQVQAVYGLTKPLVLLALIIWFAIQWRYHPAQLRIGSFVLVGLILGLIGDICLLFEAGFLAGLCAFLIGHLCYARAFQLDSRHVLRAVKAQRTSLPSRLLLVLVVLLVLLLYAALWFDLSPFMRVAVGLYCIAIVSMVLLALTRYQAYQGASPLVRRANAMVVTGALLFMLSDSLLAINRFVSPLAWDAVLILTPYFAAQYLIARFMVPQVTTAGLSQTLKERRA